MNVWGTSYSNAQTPPPSYPLYPPGMRVFAGSGSALVRNTPSLTSQCGTPPHECTAADSAPPNTNGVVQSDPAVLDPAGWWWIRVQFENGMAGWVSGYPPFVMSFTPPQLVQGTSFRIVGDYNGPVLTGARCISDGLQSDAIMQLQPNSAGQQGILICGWTTPGLGNHTQVISAVNANGTTPSTEFQFSITTAPLPPIPTAPMNLRINPATGTPAATTGVKK